VLAAFTYVHLWCTESCHPFVFVTLVAIRTHDVAGLFDVQVLGGRLSAHVDMYNASSNSWSRYPAGLGQARELLAAASLPSGLVFFAGGISVGEKVDIYSSCIEDVLQCVAVVCLGACLIDFQTGCCVCWNLADP
jgi:hypothetical protein